MSKTPTQAITMNWYNREDYARILQVMSDADQLPLSYEKWQYAAHKGERDLQGKGYVVMRVVIEPDEFVAWCTRNKVDLNAEARNRFAIEIAQAQLRQAN